MGLTGTEALDRPLYEVIADETGAEVGHAHEEFMAEVASARMAKLLQVKSGEPLLLRRRTLFNKRANGR